MTNYAVQLDRLKKHYEQSLNHYDIVSFLDLSHTLRIFTEIKDGIDNIISEPVFKKASFNNGLKRIIKSPEFIFIYLPDGVTTSAGATKEIASREIFGFNSDVDYTNGTLFKIESNGDLTISHFLITQKVLNQKEINSLDREVKNIPIGSLSFSGYMNSPAIYFKFIDNDPLFITNEELIKRIANEYEGSHADKEDTNFEINNKFSEPVSILMKYSCAKLPLPYFVLLHIAKNIIKNLEAKL